MSARRLEVADFERTQPAVHDHILGASWPQPIPTRPGYLARAWRWVRCEALRLKIRSDENYIASLRDDGDNVLDTRSAREFRRQTEEDRCRLAMLEAGR